jgi:hypothetical protein
MKNLIKVSFFVIVLFTISAAVKAQNTFPATGNVGIGTASPAKNLHLLTTTLGAENTIRLVSSDSYMSASNRNYIDIVSFPANATYTSGGLEIRLARVNNTTGNPVFTTNLRLYSGILAVSRFNDIDNINYFLDPSNTATSLNVAGGIISKEIQVVDLNTKFIKSDEIKTKNLNLEVTHVADYVFNKDYKLKSLAEVELYIKANKHLPEIPSATDMQTNGMNVADMNNLLLQKVEELTLYVINLEKKINVLETSNK